MMSNSPAEPEYERAKTSIWWDIENCPVPKGLNAHVISQNISSALMKLNYCGPLSISSYGNTNLIPNSVQIALSSTGISLNHVPSGRKDASDKKILVDMFLWVLENPAPANLMLISGDGDFSDALHRLKMKRYNILLAHPQQASPSLVASTNTTWIWTSLLDGCSSLIPCESSPLLGTAHFSRDSEVISGAVSEHVLSRQKLLKNCCEKSETAWLCKVCNGTCKIFDTLTLHLSSKEHAAQWEPKQNTTFFGEPENMAAEPSDCHEKDVEMKNKMVDAGVEANVRCGLCREVCPCQTSLDSHPKNAALVKKQAERESERSGGEFCQDFKETLESDCVVPLNFDCASLDFGLPKEVRDAIVKELEPSQNEIVIENLEGVLKQDLQMKSGEPKYAHVVMNEHLEEEINEKKRSRRRKKKSTMIKDGAEMYVCSMKKRSRRRKKKSTMIKDGAEMYVCSMKNCSETSESAWLCKVCNINCKSFELLTLHLSGKEHAAQWVPKQNLTLSGEREKKDAAPSDSHEKDVEMKNKMFDAGVEATAHYGLCSEVCPGQTSLDSHPQNAALVKKQAEKASERSGRGFCQDFKETLESDCVAPLNLDCASRDFVLSEEVRDAILKELEPPQNEIVIENLEGVLKQDLEMRSGELNEHLEEDMNKKKKKKNRKKKKSTVIEDGAETYVCSICSVICDHPAVFESHLNGQKHAAAIRKHTGALLDVKEIQEEIIRGNGHSIEELWFLSGEASENIDCLESENKYFPKAESMFTAQSSHELSSPKEVRECFDAIIKKQELSRYETLTRELESIPNQNLERNSRNAESNSKEYMDYKKKGKAIKDKAEGEASCSIC